ncbi:MAG: efflux transporter outer membrane subunit [Candidatus Omnitrophica bacterium]|nr:efflux transporter outer membrane subunit [Candidatus Omnitrophota bacterium]
MKTHSRYDGLNSFAPGSSQTSLSDGELLRPNEVLGNPTPGAKEFSPSYPPGIFDKTLLTIKPIACAWLILLAGCAVGPKYVRPAVPVPAAYKENKDWKIAQPQDNVLKGEWWKIFNDPQLDALEAQVDISNQNIAAAQARYAQAYALVQASRSSFFPVLTANGSYTRSHGSSPVKGKNVSSQTLLNADVTWEVDLWGKIRRTIESNLAQAQASAADLANARLSAQAQLAQDYFELAALDGQKKLLDDTVVLYKKFLQLTKNRYAGGVAGQSDVIQAQTQLEATRAQDIDIGVARSQVEHAIAVLIGKPASVFSIPSLTLPSAVPFVPAGLPSQLLERRPDIASAERTVAAANASIGVAEAAYFPTLILSASGSYESSNLADLFSSPNPLWSLGPALAETIFDAGLRRSQTAQAKAVYDEDVANYRQTVLAAFGQVEDNLAALRILQQENQVQDVTVKDARKAVDLEMNQYKQGTVSALDVITTQAGALADERTDVTILGQRLNACVLLIEYLGGGWTENRVISGIAVEGKTG